jgi:hypothetical protein
MILQHYQAGHTVSSKLRATLEALQLELGCRGNLFLRRLQRTRYPGHRCVDNIGLGMDMEPQLLHLSRLPGSTIPKRLRQRDCRTLLRWRAEDQSTKKP